jgi:hypothetical protein
MSSTIGCINTAEVGTPGRYGGMDWVRVNWLFQYSGIQQQVWDNLAAFPDWFQEQMQEQRR